MTQEQILKCFIFANVFYREQAIQYGVTCDDSFDMNIRLALRHLALIQFADEDVECCYLTTPMSCELDEFVKQIKNDKIYKCFVEESCPASIEVLCDLIVVLDDDPQDCPNITVQKIL
jgi:hypothetical protein